MESRLNVLINSYIWDPECDGRNPQAHPQRLESSNMLGSFMRAFLDPIILYACETWITTRADLPLIRKSRDRHPLKFRHQCTDVLMEQRRLSVTLRGSGCTRL
jgi:hypothetical protein